uniref:RNA-directed DNA polymerase homolog n=1 Tax=Nicotiana tabacum TaxID=4097 RepID=A0A1S4B9I9_TOBAC|nr:PREDICTED: RNA-directed DNA polymerase homolog [Nicotiana tabacum]
MDYRKLNNATRKDHFFLPFIDQMLDRLAGQEYYYFLDSYSGYNQIAIAPYDQDKTTFTCLYGTYTFKRMSFGLSNAPATFQRLREKDVPFKFDDACLKAFEELKGRLVTAPIIIAPNWE